MHGRTRRPLRNWRCPPPPLITWPGSLRRPHPADNSLRPALRRPKPIFSRPVHVFKDQDRGELQGRGKPSRTDGSSDGSRCSLQTSLQGTGTDEEQPERRRLALGMRQAWSALQPTQGGKLGRRRAPPQVPLSRRYPRQPVRLTPAQTGLNHASGTPEHCRPGWQTRKREGIPSTVSFWIRANQKKRETLHVAECRKSWQSIEKGGTGVATGVRGLIHLVRGKPLAL